MPLSAAIRYCCAAGNCEQQPVRVLERCPNDANQGQPGLDRATMIL